MSQAARLTDEPGRIAALVRLMVLDTAAEPQFDKITSLVRTVLDVPIAAVSLIDNERQWFKSMQGLDATETPRNISFCTHTITSRSPLNVGDAWCDDRFRDNPLVTQNPNIRAYLGAPLQTSDGYNIGALCAIDTRQRDFSPQHEKVLEAFASLVIDELELRLIASRDALTGAMSRRAFLQRAEGQSANRNQPLSTLAIFDIDHFKSINDSHGHPFGDEVLKRVVETCVANLAGCDVIGRLGGEEFGVLFARQDLDAAHAAAERLRRAIAGLVFGSVPNLKVSASFGLAELSQGSIDAAMAEADAALYVAKRAGRNRCRSLRDVMVPA